MSGKTLIVGGGVAGLSAAVYSLTRGSETLLVEKNRNLGGRARTVYLPDLKVSVDNGQHVLAANYRATRKFLKQIGAVRTVDFRKRLQIAFGFAGNGTLNFRTWPLPSPLHFGLPLMLKKKISGEDRKALMAFHRAFSAANAEELRRMTVREWLQKSGQTPFLLQLLWEPITLSALNTSLSEASALLFYRVLREAFLAGGRRAGLGLPGKRLGDIFANPAEKFIRERGGTIRTAVSVRKLIFEKNRVKKVTLSSDEELWVDRLILALPPYALARLLQNSGYTDADFIRRLKQFSYNPILTVNLWTEKPLPEPFPKALINSPFHWIFPHPYRNSTAAGYGYALVSSVAAALCRLPSDQILAKIDREFRRFFGKSLRSDFQLNAYKIIKEKRATPSQTPAFLKLRPGVQTAISNLLLAGDWLDTGLPATIESAVISGKMAAEMAV